MTEPLGAIPPELRSVAGRLDDVSSRVKDVFTQLNAQLTGEGAPWGEDSTGKEFSDGSEGYLAQSDWVNSAIAAKTELLDGYSNSMTTTANSFEQQDQQPALPAPGAATLGMLPREAAGLAQPAGPGQVFADSAGVPPVPREVMRAESGVPGQVFADSAGVPPVPREVMRAQSGVPAEFAGDSSMGNAGVPPAPREVKQAPPGQVLEGSPGALPVSPRVSTPEMPNSVVSDELSNTPSGPPATPAASFDGASSGASVIDSVVEEIEQLASPAGEAVSSVISAAQSGGTGAVNQGKLPGNKDDL